MDEIKVWREGEGVERRDKEREEMVEGKERESRRRVERRQRR